MDGHRHTSLGTVAGRGIMPVKIPRLIAREIGTWPHADVLADAPQDALAVEPALQTLDIQIVNMIGGAGKSGKSGKAGEMNLILG